MARLSLRDEALTTTFHDVHALLQKTVHRFVATHGGQVSDYQELIGLCFMKCYANHERPLARFSTWVAYALWHECLELQRASARRAERLPTVFLQPADDQDGNGLAELPARPAPPFRLMEFVRGLSADAQDVVLMALTMPADLTEQLRTQEDAPTPINIRAAVQRFLRNLGWGAARVRRTFDEIADALRGERP